MVPLCCILKLTTVMVCMSVSGYNSWWGLGHTPFYALWAWFEGLRMKYSYVKKKKKKIKLLWNWKQLIEIKNMGKSVKLGRKPRTSLPALRSLFPGWQRRHFYTFSLEHCNKVSSSGKMVNCSFLRKCEYKKGLEKAQRKCVSCFYS